MHRYILRRLLFTLLVMFGVTIIVFTIMSFTPGNPAMIILGSSANKEAIDQLNHELGVDQPFFTRLYNYFEDIILRFDFGKSYRTREPVVKEILNRLPYTIRLSFISVVLSSFIGITLGTISAIRQYSLFDSVFTTLSMIFAAVPPFWLGMMLMLIFSLNLGLLPSSGLDTWKNYILPVTSLTIGSTVSIQRITRSSTLEVIRQDYVRTARAKGATEKDIIIKHILKNALLPVITMLGLNFGFLLGGSIITETVFSLPGLGIYIVNAIRMKDTPAVMAGSLFLAGLFSIIMLLVDVAHAYVDPRIKAKYTN